ncbi:MAG: RHS repeat-associated core domain-containing protein, partial [Kordiimonas sp.]
YVYGPGIDTPLMVLEGSTKKYLHLDGKGSMIAATSAAGAVTNKFTTDVYGQGADEATSPYRFTARRVDEETGNYYYRNRYYNPKQGRFMSQDPIGYADGLNMYAYVHNDPVNNVDPMGLSGEFTCTGSRIRRTADDDKSEAETCHAEVGTTNSAGAGGFPAAAGGGRGGYSISVPIYTTQSATQVPCAAGENLAACFVITALRTSSTSTFNPLLHDSATWIGSRLSGSLGSQRLPGDRAGGSGWTAQEINAYYGAARARAAETAVILGYGRAFSQDIRTAVNIVAAGSVALFSMPLAFEAVSANVFLKSSYLGANFGLYEGLVMNENAGAIATRTLLGGTFGAVLPGISTSRVATGVYLYGEGITTEALALTINGGPVGLTEVLRAGATNVLLGSIPGL